MLIANMKAFFMLYTAVLVTTKQVQAEDADDYGYPDLDEKEARLKEISRSEIYQSLNKSSIYKKKKLSFGKNWTSRDPTSWKPPSSKTLDKLIVKTEIKPAKIIGGIIGVVVVCSICRACTKHMCKKKPAVTNHDPEETVPALPPESSQQSPYSFQRSPFSSQPISSTEQSHTNMSPQPSALNSPQPIVYLHSPPTSSFSSQPIPPTELSNMSPQQPVLNSQQPFVHSPPTSSNFQQSSIYFQQSVPYTQQPIPYPPPQTSFTYPTEPTTYPPPENTAVPLIQR